MNNSAHARLEKLAGDLGFHRTLRMSVIILLGLLSICFAIWLGLLAYDKPIPDWFRNGSGSIGILLVIFIAMMMINFDNLKGTREDLQELMKRAQRQTDLLNLLNPMVADAFRLDPVHIRPALVERLIESVIDELKTDWSAASRNFLQQQPGPVKDLVRDRCTSILKSRQVELARRLDAAERSNQLVPPHETELLVDAMAKVHEVLNLIPNQFPEVQIPMPAGARIMTEMPLHHVADAHS